MRNKFISNTDVQEALDLYMQSFTIDHRVESIATELSLDRITAAPVYALTSSPNYNAAAMDGIAVISDRTRDARDTNPLVLMEGTDYIQVNTGNPIDDPYDAVIMIEDVVAFEPGKIRIMQPAFSWQHVRLIGEDIVATEMILPSKHKIRPIDIGALLAGSVAQIPVFQKPRVAIIPTGSEIVSHTVEPREGSVIDSNSFMFEALIRQAGGLPSREQPVPDEPEAIAKAISQRIQDNDIVLVGAGSSAGSKDYTSTIIDQLGAVIVHGIAIKPGKPTVLGVIKGKPVLGMPGYPVSSYLAFQIFVLPIIHQFLGNRPFRKGMIQATMTGKVVSSMKFEEWLRLKLGFIEGRWIATPLQKGAGVSMSLVRADGLGVIPRQKEGLDAGESIQVELLKEESEIRETLISIGSHDIIMDVLADRLPLSSSHVGSMGGILAMKRREAHLAPIHLLDTGNGEYNRSYVQRYFQSEKMALIKGVTREQGLIVKKGNPKNILSYQDLARKDVRFVNRQRGAGTRILLDYHIQRLNLSANEIDGYETEMNTHIAVANFVKNDKCDVGLGVLSAAKAMDLDFIPLDHEEYDFLVYRASLSDCRIAKFISVLQSQDFLDELARLGGYGWPNIGLVLTIE